MHALCGCAGGNRPHLMHPPPFTLQRKAEKTIEELESTRAEHRDTLRRCTSEIRRGNAAINDLKARKDELKVCARCEAGRACVGGAYINCMLTLPPLVLVAALQNRVQQRMWCAPPFRSSVLCSVLTPRLILCPSCAHLRWYHHSPRCLAATRRRVYASPPNAG